MAKSNRLNLRQYEAMRTAYGLPFERKDRFYSSVKAFLYIFIYTYPLYGYIWVSVFYGLLAMIYEFIFINNLNLRRAYRTKAFDERNKFINLTRQKISNKDLPSLNAIRSATQWATGEFKKDLQILLIHLNRFASPKKVHEIIARFGDKYADDIYFQQFCEQLETCVVDGKINLNSLERIQSRHNQIASQREGHIQDKVGETWNFKLLYGLFFAGNVSLYAVDGTKKYLEFAHSTLGLIIITVYLALLFLVFRIHLANIENDNVTEASRSWASRR